MTVTSSEIAKEALQYQMILDWGKSFFIL